MQTHKIPNKNYIAAVEDHIKRGLKIKVEQERHSYLGELIRITINKGHTDVCSFVIRHYFDCGTLLINDYTFLHGGQLRRMFGPNLHVSDVKRATTMMLDFFTYNLFNGEEFSIGRETNARGYNLLSTVSREDVSYDAFVNNFKFERLVDFTNPNYITERSVSKRSIVMLKASPDYLVEKYPFLTYRSEKIQKKRNDEKRKSNYYGYNARF